MQKIDEVTKSRRAQLGPDSNRPVFKVALGGVIYLRILGIPPCLANRPNTVIGTSCRVDRYTIGHLLDNLLVSRCSLVVWDIQEFVYCGNI